MKRFAGGEQVVRPGVVSVVLVNYRGADDTITCLGHLQEMDWPADRLELIVVDNDSGDGSADRIRAAVPDATVVEAGSNTGFAGGCNLGVDHATGEFVAFLNNDARPHAQWVTAAVAALREDERTGAVASKVLDWDGEAIDYVDGSLTWFGMGYKREVGRADSPEFDQPKDVLFATGAATVMPAAVFREVGGFDERFFMFYEDVDLGWRLNLLGYRVRYVPTSIAYHKHHVTMKKFGNYRESYLLERNALLSMYKNFDDESLAKALPAAMALAVRRSLARTDTDATVLTCSGRPATTTSARSRCRRWPSRGRTRSTTSRRTCPACWRRARSSRPGAGAATGTCSRCSGTRSSPRTGSRPTSRPTARSSRRSGSRSTSRRGSGCSS